jgi:integrase/recombinase XerC/integrase/recombinase XerD
LRLRALAAEFSPPGTWFAVAGLDAEENVDRLTAWFTARWSGRAAATFNRHLDALRSAASFWIGQGWLTADPSRRLRRRGRAPDRTRALGAAEVEALLGLDVPIREKALWTMLYETAARSSEVLALNLRRVLPLRRLPLRIPLHRRRIRDPELRGQVIHHLGGTSSGSARNRPMKRAVPS